MRVICAWCNEEKGEKEPLHGKWAYVITHCICDDCMKAELAKWEKPTPDSQLSQPGAERHDQLPDNSG